MEKLVGARRFILTFYGITAFMVIQILHSVEPTALGIGIAIILAPQMASKFGEKKVAEN